MGKLKKVTEYSYLAVMALYVAYRGFKNTSFGLPFPKGMDRYIFAALIVVVFTQWITHFSLKNDKGVFSVSDLVGENAGIIAGAVILAVSVISYNINTYIEVPVAGALIAGAIGTDAGKLLKTWAVIIGSVIFVTFFAASSGIIENYVFYYVRPMGFTIRGSLGVVYPTNCASWLLFLFMVVWIAWDKIPDLVMLFVSAIGLLFVFFYTDSNTSTLCMVMFIVSVLMRRCEGFGKAGSFIGKAADICAIALTPLATVFMVVISFLYGQGKSIAILLNEKLDNRFMMGAKAIEEHGITPFGTYFKMKGFGASSVVSSFNYNYLDSSYLNALIRYGYVMYLVFIILWIYVILRAIKSGNRKMVYVAIVIAMHSVMEHHFIHLIYNPLFLVGFAVMTGNGSSDQEVKLKRRGLLIVAAVTGCLYFGLPVILDCSRSVADMLELSKEDRASGAVEERIEADRDAVEVIMNACTAPVYADVFPIQYQKAFDGFSKSKYIGGDHARQGASTILTNKDDEESVLISSGYLFAQISDYSAVYTRDIQVQHALMDAGYHVTGHYSAERNAVITEENKVQKLRLTDGPYVATWKLKLTEELPDDNGIVCLLRATTESDNGQRMELARTEVVRSEFDSEGFATTQLRFNRGESSDVNLVMRVSKGYEVLIEECSYAQVWDIDTHQIKDEMGNVIRREYYDPDGNPITLPTGEFAAEYEHGDDGAVTCTRYYDLDGVLIREENNQ